MSTYFLARNPRVPRVFWVNALSEWLLGQKGKIPQRLRSLVMLRTAVPVGCPFELTPILPTAE